MPNKRANQHRWRNSVSDQIQRHLENAANELKESWSIDSGDPRLYPFMSEIVLNDLRDRISNRPRSTRLPSVPDPRPQPEPEKLMDLIDEKVVGSCLRGSEQWKLQGRAKESIGGRETGTCSMAKDSEKHRPSIRS